LLLVSTGVLVLRSVPSRIHLERAAAGIRDAPETVMWPCESGEAHASDARSGEAASTSMPQAPQGDTFEVLVVM
jgi:hypothetical protein